MPSKFTRLKAGYPVFAVVAFFAVLASQPSVSAADRADRTAKPRNPALTAQANSTTQSTKTAQPDSTTQSEKSTQSAAPTPSVEGAADEDQTETTSKSESEPATKTDKSDKPEAAGQPADKSENKTDTTEEKKPEKAEQKKGEGTVGEPLAPGMIKLVQEEIVSAIKRRGITDRFARFQNYAISKVNSSAGRYTGSELTGNCRLKWYDHLMRNMLAAPAEAERFTRELHMAACGERDGFARALSMASAKMDLTARKPHALATANSGEQALEVIKQALTAAQVSYCAALAPLDKSEIQQLQTYIVPVLCTQNVIGHTLNDRGTGRLLCDLMEKMNRDALYAAADALAPITDVQLLEQLKTLPDQGNVKVAGVTGPVAARIDTPSGAIVIEIGRAHV
jgi:hypothetical protein